MVILADSIRSVASYLLTASAGEGVRRVEAVTRDQVRRYKEVVLQETLRLAVDSALGPARVRRKPSTPIPWSCPGCGPRLATQVMRNGTYGRTPLTNEGPIHIRVPQLACRECGRSVPVALPCLPRWRRVLCDVEHALTQAYLLGHSYRVVAERTVHGARLGLMTAWRSLQRVAEGPHRPPPTPALVAVGLDEVHTRVHGRTAWYLVARGRTADGKGHYLGAILAEDRSQAAWELGLDRLGLQQLPASLPLITDGDAALEAALAQCLPGRPLRRCAWHLLHNVGEWLRERLPGSDQAGQRRGLMAAAQAVVNAATPQARRASLALLADAAPWLGSRLSATLDRIAYPDPVLPRTNNVCERPFREWRRRTRPMDGFGSWTGARNFGGLWMVKENCREAGKDWMEAIMP